MRSVKDRRWLIGAIALALFSLGPGPAPAADLTKTIEGAKKEGKFVLYTAMQPEDSNLLLNLYRNRYPFIDATYFRAGSAPLLNRVLTEAQAGKYLFDVVSGKVSDLLLLKKKGLLSPLRSDELNSYDARFKDLEAYWVDIYSNYYAVAFNTAQVKANEIPARWEQLFDPKWSGGKIGLDPRSYDWYFGILSALGPERGKAFMQRLSGQKPSFRDGNVLIANLLAAGEFPLAITYAHLIERLKERGAPVDWITVNPMVAIPISIAAPRRPPHPDAARLFLDLALSKEGAELLKGMGRVPTRKDVPPSAKRLDPRSLDLFPLRVSSDEMEPRTFRKVFALE